MAGTTQGSPRGVGTVALALLVGFGGSTLFDPFALTSEEGRPPRTCREEYPELVAQSSEARLVRALDGTVELVCGNEEDRDEAREWCREFRKGIPSRKGRG